MSLSSLLRDKLTRHNLITIAEYVALALEHPEFGYYMRRDPFGAKGDFITAPEISQIFGELLGAWVADGWLKQGGGEAILMELGPGRGTLMKDALRATRNVAGFHAAIEIHMLESSPKLQELQQQTLKDAHHNIRWHSEWPELPPEPLWVIANEFFDALPIAQYVFSGGRWRERVIRQVGDKLEYSLHPEPASLEVNYPVGEGDVIERSVASEAIMKKLVAHIAAYGGGALIVDYGYDLDAPTGDTLQAVKAHQFHPVLDTPGEADITAHVDFRRLANVAEEMDAKTFGAVEQGSFLMRLGAAERLAQLCANATLSQQQVLRSGVERLISPEQMGRLFKLLAVMPPDAETPAGF